MKITQRGVSLALSVCLVYCAGADWPHSRGPSYDGVSPETGLVETWPEEGPPQLWTRELGQGHSGFIVADGKVFTQRQKLGGQYLLCLDPDTGETVWETRYDWAWQPSGAYPGPYATPTWYRGKVYWSSPSGLLGCTEASTGKELWSLNVLEKFGGKGYGFGFAATLLVEDDRVIVPAGGASASLVALSANDGQVLWTAGSDPASYCSAMPITFQGRRCVVGFLENHLLLVETATGKVLHRQQFSTGYGEHSAWPLYRAPHLFLASPFFVPARCLELKLAPDGSLLCSEHWTRKEFCNDVVSSVLYENYIFGFDIKQQQASGHRPSRGTFKCLEWATGKICWSTSDVGHAAVLAADGKLLLLNDEGWLILARADATAYKELARTQLFKREICWTPPTLWQGRLFVRSPSRAVCLYVGRDEDRFKEVTAVPRPKSAGSWQFSAEWLASRERDYPNDAPSWEEMTLWFGASVLIVFGGAALGTGLVSLVATKFVGHPIPGLPVFLALGFLIGLLGPNLFSELTDQFLFTWPASLFAAFFAAVSLCSWAQKNSHYRRSQWLARLGILAFVLLSYGYFVLCRAIGMYVAWCFLIGFVVAFPVTLLAVRATLKQGRTLIPTAWMLLAFGVYFWSCQGYLLWKSAQAE
jgi:PQQ-like domain